MTALSLRAALPGPLRSQWKRPLVLLSRRHASTFPDLPVLRAIASHDPASTSIIHSVSGRSFTYGNLVGDVLVAQKRLEQVATKNPKAQGLEGRPVAFLAENSYDYVGTALYFKGDCGTRD